MIDDKHHDEQSRKWAWYYLRSKGQPVTTSYYKKEGVALAHGRNRAGEMARHLKDTEQAPKRGTRLVACGFDGQPELGELIEGQREAGARCWLEYTGLKKKRFEVYPLEPVG
mgnify:CR=1 FL=1